MGRYPALKLGFYKASNTHTIRVVKVLAVGKVADRRMERSVIYQNVATDLINYDDELRVTSEWAFMVGVDAEQFVYMSPRALLWWRIRWFFIELFSGESIDDTIRKVGGKHCN